MTAQPIATHPPLTAAEFFALHEDDSDARYELQEGELVVAAAPMPDHQDCMGELYAQLRVQTPAHLKTLQGVEIDLGLAPATHPGTVRIPDLTVVTRAAFLLARRRRGALHARDVVLAIEIHPTSNRRTDTVIKHAEYADAGIDHYWMVDLLAGPSLTAGHRGGEFGYVDADPVRGTVRIDLPFPAELDLARLVD